jgi:hypothetical protein
MKLTFLKVIFYLIKSNHIKYWDSKVMASLAENKQYLDGTLKIQTNYYLRNIS